MEALVNKKALFDYEVLEKFEAGLKLTGTEVKSIKSGRISFDGSYISFRQGEIFWVKGTIPPYQPKNTPAGYDPSGPRKLLLTKKELKYLYGKSQEGGLTIIPIKIYNSHGNLKIEIGIVKRKKKWDKRENLKKKQSRRDAERDLKDRNV